MKDRALLALVAAARAGLAAKLAIACAVVVGGMMLALVALAAWWSTTAATSARSQCEPPAALAEASGAEAPAWLVPLFSGAADRYELGAEGPSILAGLTKVESDFGRNMGPSSAGAVGWTQFMPATWARYGVDANGDGRRDPFHAADAIYSSARYLRASGAPARWRDALFAYNHASWYVDRVLRVARSLRASIDIGSSGDLPCAPTELQVGGTVQQVTGGGEIVPIPGFPGESIDSRILADVLALQRRYRFAVTDGYAPTGHEPTGEHPLGLAVDLVPGRGGSWDDIDELAAWAEPQQDKPRPPFRFVGYDGDADHGRGDHLHLSWDHAPAPSRKPPAAWVRTLSADGSAR